MSAFPAAWGMPVARPGLAGCGAGCSGVGWSPAVGGHIGGDVEGAGGVAEVVVAVGAGPQVGAGVEGRVGPRGVGLESVMGATQGCDVAGAAPASLEDRDDDGDQGSGDGAGGFETVAERPPRPAAPGGDDQ